MLEYRTALRAGLRRLDPAHGPAMIASFASSDRRPCDVENLLLYHVGISAFAHLHSEEVVLARSFAPPTPRPDGDAGVLGYHHRYRLAAQAPAAPWGEVVARFPAVAVRRPVTVEKVWYDLRASGQVEVERRCRGRRLRLDLRLHRPWTAGDTAVQLA